MPESNPETLLMKYLYDTEYIRYKQKNFHPLEDENKDLWLTAIPWSLDFAALNVGISRDELKKLISRLDFLQIDQEQRYAQNFQLIKVKGDSADHFPSSGFSADSIVFPSNMTVGSAINTYILTYLLKRVESDNSLIPVEDAIFSLKNSIGIPDDFMPDYLMASVEGSVPVKPSTVSESIQPVVGSRLIHIFPEFVDQNPGRVRYLYPSRSFTLENLPSLEALQKAISDSFRNLQASPSFSDFKLSRYLKDVIYLVEIKHSRALEPPLFNSYKLALLSTLDIIDPSPTGGVLKSNIEPYNLRDMMNELKERASTFSSSWQKSEISIQ